MEGYFRQKTEYLKRRYQTILKSINFVYWLSTGHGSNTESSKPAWAA